MIVGIPPTGELVLHNPWASLSSTMCMKHISPVKKTSWGELCSFFSRNIARVKYPQTLKACLVGEVTDYLSNRHSIHQHAAPTRCRFYASKNTFCNVLFANGKTYILRKRHVRYYDFRKKLLVLPFDNILEELSVLLSNEMVKLNLGKRCLYVR